MLLTLFAVLVRTHQDPPSSAEVLTAFGLSENKAFLATAGIATISDSEFVELVGVSNLAQPELGVWKSDGSKVSEGTANKFWDAMDLKIDAKELYAADKEGRTFAMVFRLSKGLTRALDVRQDEGKSFKPLMAQSRINEGNFVSRVIGPMKDEQKIDFRLEAPGGAWTDLVTFPIAGETKERGIEVIKGWKNTAEFVNVNGVEEAVKIRTHYFTVTAPEALREMDLAMFSNDPIEDATMLGEFRSEHIEGEDQGKEFAGKELFIVPCLNKLNFERSFTLRARPKRIVEFRAIPLKR